MECLPAPRATTILPPPFNVNDAWEALPALQANDMDDFGSSDPAEWYDAGRSTDFDQLNTMPVPRAANQ